MGKKRCSNGGNAIKALEIDKKCICCGESNDLVIHHWNKNKKDNRIENLITICRGCHAKLHNEDRDFGNKNNPLYGVIKLSGVYLLTVRDAISGIIKRRQMAFNLIPTVGRAAIANALSDSSPSPANLRVNYVAVGTGTNVPANGDTTLQTETYRNAVASQTNANNVAYQTGFFNATECNGTYKEAGLFIAGTAAADSGTLLSRVAINITKANTETLTLDWSLTIS